MSLVSFFDTATEPTEAMREAMRTARVGDDVYGRDPTVNELEARGAQLLGQEAAVLVPSGTMGNLAAVLAHTNRGEAVLLEEQSHLVRAEAGGIATIAGCMPVTVSGRRGVMRAEDVQPVLLPPDEHRPLPTLLCVENTHNRCGGTVTTPAVMAASARSATRAGCACTSTAHASSTRRPRSASNRPRWRPAPTRCASV